MLHIIARFKRTKRSHVVGFYKAGEGFVERVIDATQYYSHDMAKAALDNRVNKDQNGIYVIAAITDAEYAAQYALREWVPAIAQRNNISLYSAIYHVDKLMREACVFLRDHSLNEIERDESLTDEQQAWLYKLSGDDQRAIRLQNRVFGLKENRP